MGRASLLASCLLGVTTLGATASPNRATSAHQNEPAHLWVIDGTVSTIAPTPAGVFVGGDFTLIGPPTGSWVEVGATGAPLAPKPRIEGGVTTATPDDAGGWYLRGDALTIAGAERHGVVHLRRDGSLDHAFRLVSNGSIDSLARVGTTLYVGGSFTSLNGSDRTALAAVDTRTGEMLPWQPRLSLTADVDPDVSTVAVSGDGKTIYFAGDFERVGKKRRASVAAVDAGGTILRFNPHPDDAVSTIALDLPRHVVYLAGDFTTVDGTDRPSLAAVDATTGRLTRWNPNCDGTVDVVRVSPQGSPVYVGGEFASIGDKSRRSLAAVDAGSGAATPWDPNVGGTVNSIVLEPKRKTLVVGGEFGSIGDAARSNLGAIDTRTGLATPWDPKPVGTVDFLASERSGVIRVAGEFDSIGAVARAGVAEFTPDGSRLLPFAPTLTGPVRVLASDAAHARVYVGGRFTLGGERTAVSTAVIDLGTGAVSHWGPTINSGVWVITPSMDGSTVYLGGAFATIDNKARRRLAQVDASGSLTDWNAGANGTVRDMILSGDTLYVAGQFSSIAGESHRGLAVLDAATGRSVGFDAAANGNVTSIALAGDTLYAAGDFETIGGASRKGLGAVDTGAGTASRWDVSPDDEVDALAVSPDGTRLTVAGGFERIAGGRRSVAEFDLTSGFLTSWTPDAPFTGHSLAYSADGSLLYLGAEGAFGVYR